MRILTQQQKKLLDSWFEESKEELLISGGIFFVPSELRQKLIEINDAEFLFQNIDRYISDKISDSLYG